MTIEEIYWKVRKHLLTQMERSVTTVLDYEENEETICAYRGDRGLMCAIGCLIPDERYHPKLENRTVWDREVASAILGPETRIADCREEIYTQMNELQEIHDDNHPVFWRKKLEEFAQRYEIGGEA